MDETLGTDPNAPTQASLAEGSTLGAYRIERLLGEGAMGEVYLATHTALGRPVALKTLKQGVANRTLLERFFAEARAVNIIRHENIVECTDLVNDPGGRSYIVMELLEGRTLAVAIQELGRIPPRRAARIVAQIADAIGAAHGKGIVHRDLKPDNVFLIRRAGSADYVKVLDFGIARLRPEHGVSATQSGILIGTPAYMSPEQVRGEKVGPSADIYALGAIFFHMLTGRLPFDVASMSMMLIAQLQETPPRVDQIAGDVPRGLADLVARTLAKAVDQRPPDMATFRREALEAAGMSSDAGASLAESSSGMRAAGYLPTLAPTSAGQSSISGSAGAVESSRASAVQVVPTSSSKRGWWIGVAAGAVVAGIAATVIVLSSSKSGDTSKPADTSQQTAAAAATTPPAPVVVADPPAPPPPKPAVVAPPAPPPEVKPEPPQEVKPAPAPPPEPVAVAPPKPTPVKPTPVKPKPAAVKPKPTPVKPAPIVKPKPPVVAVAPAPVPAPKPPTPPAPTPPPAPALDCSLDGFVRVYESCADKNAARGALRRLNACRDASQLKVDYDVVKRALVRCL